MSLKFNVEYFNKVRDRYYRSSKKQKSVILDEICQNTDLERKHVIKMLARGHHQGPKASGRTQSYSDASIYHLKKLWHLMGRICSKRMIAAFPIWLEFYEGKGFGPIVKDELLSMSSSTVDRYLRAYKAQFARNRRSATNSRGAKKFQAIVPLKLFEKKEITPGFVEADTVAHCGNSLSGKFAWSLTMTDVSTGWTNNRAFFGKGADETLSAIISIHDSLPYTLKSLNVDNGTEFLNRYFLEYFRRKNSVKLTRSRPYRKNDNCHVEQKNFTHVREVFRYSRIDHEELIKYMNEIYRDYFNPLQNFFTPQIKMIEKSRVGSRYVRKYDQGKTPCHRLLESGVLSMKQKSDLEKVYNSLNPIELKRGLSKKISQFNSLKKSLDKRRKEDIYLPSYYDVKRYTMK